MPAPAPAHAAGRRPTADAVGFTAFCELQWQRYRLVALLATGDDAEADGAVRDALGDLADQWHDALASPSVTAYAWPLVKRRITRNHPPLGELADELLLGRILHLTHDQITDTTGRPAPWHRAPKRPRLH